MAQNHKKATGVSNNVPTNHSINVIGLQVLSGRQNVSHHFYFYPATNYTQLHFKLSFIIFSITETHILLVVK